MCWNDLLSGPETKGKPSHFKGHRTKQGQNGHCRHMANWRLIVQRNVWCTQYFCETWFKTKTIFCGHHICLNPDLRLTPYLVVVIWNPDLAVNGVHWTFSATTRFLHKPDFPLHEGPTHKCWHKFTLKQSKISHNILYKVMQNTTQIHFFVTWENCEKIYIFFFKYFLFC